MNGVSTCTRLIIRSRHTNDVLDLARQQHEQHELEQHPDQDAREPAHSHVDTTLAADEDRQRMDTRHMQDAEDGHVRVHVDVHGDGLVDVDEPVHEHVDVDDEIVVREQPIHRHEAA